MAYEFKLPDIGEGVVEGEIVRWMVKEGDVVRRDQPMVEVMTDKATVEIPAPRAGRVLKRMYDEGQICPVGKTLITIDEGAASGATGAAAASGGGGASPSSSASNAKANTDDAAHMHMAVGVAAQMPSTGAVNKAVSAAPAPLLPGARRPLATPATRKLARELGVELGSVSGSGNAGRITSDDVRRHGTSSAAGASGAAGAAAKPSAARSAPMTVSAETGDVRIPLRGVRKKIAENMLRSKHSAAHFTYVEEVDCTDLVALRAKANTRLADRKIKLSYLPFIVKAVVGALKRYPQMNATFDESTSEIVQRRSYHIGIASATADGLIVPVIHDADRRSIVGLAQEIDRLAQATKIGKVSRADLTGSTFTITSLGNLGGVMATEIINFPEVGILGIHKIAKRPVVHQDQIAIREMMNLSISVDHRLVDGYDAALFVAEVKQSLETPGLLFLDALDVG